ncbi:hypothetical protein [Microbacterium sp. H83]|uniref:hypothetical protein n=1 Tax=Microbacterium sp. H83 TaxID=1827324 RepID=UPI0012F8D855|nr:hypothetical protein [Microbacterium sp. H83]
MSVHLQRDGSVFVQTYSEMTGLADIGDGLPLVVESMNDPERLGAVVLDALRASNRRPLPYRNLREDPPDREFLAWLGVQSYGRYMRGVRSLGVDAHFDEVIREITITPESNDGPRGGFSPISEERFSIMFESPEQLGRAVQAAMAKATL